MKPLVKLASIAVVLAALSAPASAQIIATSLPTLMPGAERDEFSAHVMVTPFAKWDYKEVYLAPNILGTVGGDPNSDFMIAGEVAAALGGGNWSLTAGGWYNKLGTHDFDLAAFALLFPLTAKVPVELSIYEGHVGIFYKSVGVQGGLVRTDQRVSGSLNQVVWGGIELGDLEDESTFDVTTNDWAMYAVYRRSSERWGASAGVGAYIKQAIKEGSPLRFGSDETVLSAFVTANVNLYKGLGIDTSYWYVGKTRSFDGFRADILEIDSSVPLLKKDSQSRFTVGLGFGF